MNFLMESVQLDRNENYSKEKYLEQLSLPGSPDIDNLFGDRQLEPRLGDDYQVEIPPMILRSEHLQLSKNRGDSEVTDDVSDSYVMGLPVLVMWIDENVTKIEDTQMGSECYHDDAEKNGSVKATKSKKNHIKAKKKGFIHSVEPVIDGLELDSGEEPKPINLGKKVTEKTKIDRLCQSRSYHPVPGSLGDPWRDAEVDAFLLGLYMFGKNFVHVKNFMEDKKMGDILSFYYGVFYKSDEYHRWSECRKKRSKKCIYGRKIFTGWRLQELLSRLHPHIQDEFQDTLLEVSMTFEEGRTSLEQYVSSLKAIVGIRALVEAVGIGRGKQDLTSLAMENTNQMFPLCPIMPTGKACSSLLPNDIIKFLTGGFRLSKARCNDIFWEAVWPRLLARGWHSEEPINQGYVNSKHPLVFLVPGIKKFSRRELVKGDQYFDSISDVLSKVASEPNLIELQPDETKDRNCSEEDGWVSEVPSDQDDSSNHRPHHYLKPRISACSPNQMKFTIVDSSSTRGGKSSKVRELRYLPVDFRTASGGTCVSREKKFSQSSMEKCERGVANTPVVGKRNSNNTDHGNSTFDNRSPDHIKFTVVDTSLANGRKSAKGRELRHAATEHKVISKRTHSDAAQSRKTGNNPSDFKDASDCVGTNLKALESNTTNKLAESHRDQKTNTSDDNQPNKIIKHQFSRRVKSCDSNNFLPLTKRRRLTACAKAETTCVTGTFSVGQKLKEEGHCRNFCSADAGDKAIIQEKASVVSSLAEGGPEEKRSKDMISGDFHGMAISQLRSEGHQPQSVIHLDLPEVVQESVNGKALPMQVDSQSINSTGSCIPSMTNRADPELSGTPVDTDTAEQQPIMNPRRQSTRNRPLTTKALEALESGFWKFQTRPKSKDRKPEIPSSPSPKSQSRIKMTSTQGSASTGMRNATKAKGLNEASFVGKDAARKPLDTIEENWLAIYS